MMNSEKFEDLIVGNRVVTSTTPDETITVIYSDNDQILASRVIDHYTHEITYHDGESSNEN